MSIRRRGIVRCALAVATSVLATVGLGVTTVAPAQADVNTSPNYLVVYDNNIENWLPASCADGYLFDRLLTYLKTRPKSPDIFTVQQISNQTQLNTLLKRLSDDLPGTYAGKIAIADPGSMGYTSTCGKLKNQQTNAVIYRSDRFTFEDSTSWRSDAPENYDTGVGGCQNLEPTRSSQDRVQNIAVRLHDNVRGEDVSVASIHWPTGTWYGPTCAPENMNEANQAMDRLGGTLKIVAGDTNAKPSSTNWWRNARDYGFRDPIAEQCGAAACSSAYNTTTNNRIDFVLVKSGNGFSNVATITEAMTGGAYSEHRAVTAYVNY
nr:endonuclease/Exonuclease/phosphatase family protein [uncultured bacterium]